MKKLPRSPKTMKMDLQTALPVMLEQWFSRKLLLITGKGGTGKTLMAASLGQLAAAQGKRVLIVECHKDSQLRPLLGGQDRLDEVVKVNEHLHWMNLVPKNGLKHYIVGRLQKAATWDRFFQNEKVTAFFEAMPGLTEVMVLGRLFHDVMLTDSWDLVIFDGPASGHYASMMKTPDAILQAGILGPLAFEVGRVRDFLADDQLCAGLYMTLPEPLVISECVEFVPQLPLPTKHHVVLNKSQFVEEDAANFPHQVQQWLSQRQTSVTESLSLLGEVTQTFDLGAIRGGLSLVESQQIWGCSP